MQSSNDIFIQALSLLLQKQAPQPLSGGGMMMLPRDSGILAPFHSLPTPSSSMHDSLLSHHFVTQALQSATVSASSRPPIIGFASGSFLSPLPLLPQPNRTSAAPTDFAQQLSSIAEQISRNQSGGGGGRGGAAASAARDGSWLGLHDLSLPSCSVALPDSSYTPQLFNATHLGHVTSQGQSEMQPAASSSSSISGDDRRTNVVGSQPPTPAINADSRIGRSAKKFRKVFPRRKTGEAERNQQDPVMLNEFVLAEYFDMPLMEASRQLGICQTTLKKTCRKFGISKWPYKTRRLESPPNIGGARSDA